MEKPEEKLVPKKEKSKPKPKPKPEELDVQADTPEVLIDWGKVEKEVTQVMEANNWTAERHRGNPQFVVGVVLKNVVPKIVKLLK